ncbi:cell division protein SepF [Rothia uropygioeca]|uniref:cell division protein SepF n=1 Tax=Kocuria sp. 257 TaxID=2021970 RepID=UPI001013BE2F|nr:cell division protein SepF [Kocuria sp. 257]
MAGTLRQAMVFLGLADDGYEAQPAAQQRRAEADTAAQPHVHYEERAPRETDGGSAALDTRSEAPSRQRPAEDQGVRQDAGSRGPREREVRQEAATARRRPESSAAPARRELEPARDEEPEDYRAPVTPINRAAAQTESDNELRRITTIHPRSYNDAKVIGESFRNNIPVIMNVTDMDVAEAKRLVDFSSGLTFALNGSIERVTEQVFLLTPANLEVLASEDVSSSAPAVDDSLFDQS